jgi:hypothetical protein
LSVLDLALEAFILINKPLSAAALLERNSHLFSDDVRKWRILARLNADARTFIAALTAVFAKF